MAVLRAKFPDKTGFLFEPHRYKCLMGGRGSGKSYAIARFLLIEGLSRNVRVLCTREVQKSIRDSVKRLLDDQIEIMGLGQHYQSLETEIRGKNGTLFLFNGLSNETVESLKSYENITYCWCEEAQSISKRSWDVLIPTIRADGSEIIMSFNPQLESDETYQRFIVNPPPDCVSAHMSYKDNPWFPDVLEQERKHCERANPDDYPNIWLGLCKPAVAGAIFFKEIQAAQLENRICRVPYDPLLKVHVVFDLGFNDLMAIGLVQKFQSDIRIIRYMEGRGQTLAAYSSDLRTLNFNWGRCWLPHDGYSRDFKTGHSSAEIMRSLGWDVPDRSEIVELSVEEGIRTVRMTFPQIVFDEENTVDLVECLKRYRRQINRQTQVAGAPLHDDFSNGADFLRYTCVNAPQMTNDSIDDYWADSQNHHRYNSDSVNQSTGY